jgi:hypothetical protein
MAVRLIRSPLDLAAERSRRLDCGRGSTRVSGVALTALAYAAYVAVMAALLVHLATGTAEIDNSGSDLAEGVNNSIAPGEPAVVIITVDGPNASVDVFCDTASAVAPFDRLHVRPEQTMDAFNRWCKNPGNPD